MRMMIIRMVAVLLALPISLPLHAEKQFPKERKESEMPSNRQDEELIAELEKILDETVNEALCDQYAELNADFKRKSDRLFKSRSFWRRAAITEGLVIAGAVFTGLMLYKIRE